MTVPIRPWSIIAPRIGAAPVHRVSRSTSAHDIVLEAPEVINRIRELTGIYGLGFRKSSVLGLVLPLAFIGLITVLSVLWFFVL